MPKLSFLKKSGIALILMALGFGLNALDLSLFLGADLFFGGVAALIALVFLGPAWAVAVSVVASSYTYSVLQHPFAIVVYATEVLGVWWLLRRCRGSLILAAGMYWLLVGCPLLWFFHYVVQHHGASSASLVTLRQAVTGIANAMIASFILFSWPRRYQPANALDAGPTLFRVIFTAVVCSIFLPGLIIVALNGRSTIQSLEENLHHRLDAISVGLTGQARLWTVQHLRIVEELADISYGLKMKPGQALQEATLRLGRMNPEFRAVYVGDKTATVIAVFPPVNDRGESTFGLNFADRPYYSAMKETLKPYISDPFQARGTTFEPVVTLSVPVVLDKQFAGYAIGALNLHRFSELLQMTAQGTPVRASIIARNGKILASTAPGVKPLDDASVIERGTVRVIENEFYQRFPSEPAAPIVQWQQSSFGEVREFESLPGWKLQVEIPAAQHLAYLYSRYSTSLAILLILTAVGYGLAALIATLVSRPLASLAEETNGLPDKIMRKQEIRWPSSSIGEVSFLIQNFQSMTDALRVRFEDLRKSNQRKDEFLANLSHELRTPLNVISGYVELLKEEGWSNDSPAFIEVISRNVSQLGRLIEELLDLSRIATGKMSLTKTSIDLAHSIEEALESIRLSADEKGLKLIYEKPVEKIWIIGDPAKLNQVWWNLLSNSLKFTPTGGEIRVRLGSVDGLAEISVQDTGIGMSPEFVSQAFGRFVQEDGSSCRAHGGLGIGLAIVREIIEKHGGSTSAASEGRNKGSTMTVRLPLLAAASDTSLTQIQQTS